MTYAETAGFWDRDNAVYTLAWRKRGMDSKFIALGDSRTDTKRPLILATDQQMRDSRWWRELKIEGIVMTTWGLPRFGSIARAIKESGTKLILVMDTDGLLAPRVWLKGYLWRKYATEKDKGNPLPLFTTVAKTLLALNKSYWKGTLDHLAHADRIAVESPLAVQFFRRFLVAGGRPDLRDRVILMPHGVTEDMRYDLSKSKEKEIITVGRWDSYVKNAPLLIQTLSKVFSVDGNYSASIIGKGEGKLKKLISRLPARIQARINIVGPLPRTALADRLQRARIFLNTSRFEGFPISPAEAVCCGCSVVGPSYSPGFHFICGQSSGSLAYDRSAQSFADAVTSEIMAWESGQRDAERIGETFCRQLQAAQVAERLLEVGRAISR